MELTISPLGEIQTFTSNADKIFTITSRVKNIMYDYYHISFFCQTQGTFHLKKPLGHFAVPILSPHEKVEVNNEKLKF